MKLGRTIILFVLLVFISIVFWVLTGAIPKMQKQNSWSNPVNIYSSPDTTNFFVFDAEVYDETINIVKTHFDTSGSHLNYSEVFLLQKMVDSEPELTRISRDDYPVEAQPVLYLNQSGGLDVFWGERRRDPNFDEFNRSGTGLLFNISTTLMHVSVANNIANEPELVFEGSLSKIFEGNGGITLPVKISEDEEERLHLVFTVEGEYEDIGGNHSIGLGYISQNESGSWNTRLLCSVKFNSDILALSKNRLLTAFRGSSRKDPDGSTNDISVILSNNGGATWSDVEPVYRSGEQVTSGVKLTGSPDGTVHLFWDRYLESGFEPFSDEVWHSVSTNGGINWSEPERFFRLVKPSDDGYHYIRSMDSVVDPYNQIHFTLVSGYGERGEDQRENRNLYYSKWSPVTKSWQQVEKFGVAERPLITKLALDKITDKLYLFWDERDEQGIYYSVKDIEKPDSPLPIAKSGPLQLHANYPNPFNSSTRISFTLEEPAQVILTVFDITGRQILQKEFGSKPAGFHSEQISLEGFTSGTYIYEVELNNTWRQQSTMMLIK